jgi:hypothetical protein
MKIEGCGYEFDAKYVGGPADGLENNVVIFNEGKPPEISCLDLRNLVESKTPLGRHLIRERPADETRVGVYMLENDPGNYTHDDLLVYHFIEMMNYNEYLIRYSDNSN